MTTTPSPVNWRTVDPSTEAGLHKINQAIAEKLGWKIEKQPDPLQPDQIRYRLTHLKGADTGWKMYDAAAVDEMIAGYINAWSQITDQALALWSSDARFQLIANTDGGWTVTVSDDVYPTVIKLTVNQSTVALAAALAWLEDQETK